MGTDTKPRKVVNRTEELKTRVWVDPYASEIVPAKEDP